jgi:class 3 adenylate cyclase
MTETRKLAAILVADVVGYSRLAGADEERTLARLRALRSDLIDPTIALHHGRIVKRTGDGSIIEFRSVVDAVRCAIEVQNGMVERMAQGKVSRARHRLRACREAEERLVPGPSAVHQRAADRHDRRHAAVSEQIFGLSRLC